MTTPESNATCAAAGGEPEPAGRKRSAAAVFPVALLVATLAVLAMALSLPGGRSERADAERILRYLSDDARGGRGSFTGGNRDAALFIASEFGAAGLSPLDSGGGFLREFEVGRYTPVSLSVVLNGRPVPDSECCIFTEAPDGSWALSDSFPVRRMGETFDRGFMEGGDGIVLVPRAHEKTFQRFRRFALRPRILDHAPRRGAVVAVLADSLDVTSASVAYRAGVDRPGLTNVVGRIQGKRPNEIVLISAHYDHLGIVRPVAGDSIANGADDNASGTTALLLLAKRFGAEGTPERTLVFAALAAEEIGGFGARHLLAELTPDSVVAMVNLEMLGKESKFGPKSFWMTGYDRSSLGAIVAEGLEGSGYAVHPDPYPAENLFFRSDNAAFAKVGVPAHTVSTTPIDVDSVYHTVDDEFDRIDPAHVAEMAEAVGIGLREVISGQKTPSRIPIH